MKYISGVLVIVGAATAGFAASAQPKKSDAIFSDAQAARGAAVYREHCRACHGAELTGTEFGPALAGAEFNARWAARPIADLHDVVRTTMPVNSPGGLTPQQNADVVALILKRAGFPSGASELPVVANDRPAAVPAAPRASESTVSKAFYTETQAARGKMLFLKNCGMCHSADPTTAKTDAQPDRGFVLGATRSVSNLGRSALRYPNVYHLFRRIRDSMPGWDIESVSPVQKLDIVAYLLKSSGLPAGDATLTLDIGAMKRMAITEPPVFRLEEGFESIFDGTRISGMKYLIGFNCTPAPAGCGRTDPAGVFKVQDSVLVAQGRYHGMMYTEKKYLDFDLRFDYRWVPPADMDPDDEFFNVSNGYLIFVEEPKIWPKGIEIEGDENGIMRPSPLTVEAKVTYDTETLARYKKAVGKWNTVRILARERQVKAYLNGGLISQVTEHPFTAPGHIAFQYQGGRMEWRNIRISR